MCQHNAVDKMAPRTLLLPPDEERALLIEIYGELYVPPRPYRRPSRGRSLAEMAPEVAAEWHPTLNGSVHPEDVSWKSPNKYWFRCPQGHSYLSALNKRNRTDTTPAGCPFCAGKRVWPGYNDLASEHPDVAAEWAYDLNGEMTPRLMSSGANKRCWWRCAERGHVWEAKPSERTGRRPTGCPFCSNRKIVVGENDLATTHPALAREWHSTKNGLLTAHDVVAGSNKKAWWEHWDANGSHHEWQATIISRARGNGCPICHGQLLPGVNDLATLFPKIAAEWHPTKNGDKKPCDFGRNASDVVWWRNEECGHEWRQKILVRTNRRSGCPVCHESTGEVAIRDWVEDTPMIRMREWSDPRCRDCHPLPFDAVLYRELPDRTLIEVAHIEYQGIQHFERVSHFDKNQKFERTQLHDRLKAEFCRDTRRLLIAIPYTVVGKQAIGEFIERELRAHGLGWALE